MDLVLELRGLSKHYPSYMAVESVSLSVERGTFYSLVGPSGCGKTTTLRLVAGLEEPTAGEILLNGAVITRQKPYQRNVNTVFQNYALFPHLTVYENVAFGLRRKGVAGVDRQVRAALELVQLAGKDKRLPFQLSGGERQRTALARALVLRPSVVLLDEPLSALDPSLRKQMRSELKQLQRSVGVTFLFVTHDQEEALSLSDRIAVMNHGRIEQTGSPQELYTKPRSRFVAGFLGGVNWVDGVGIRPENTRLSRTRPEGDTQSAAATITGSVFLGNCIHIQAELAGGQIVVAEVPPGDGSYRAGESVEVWWHPADEMVFPAELQ